MGSLSTKAMLVPRGQAAAVILDDDQVATVGEGAKRFPVVATVNGYTWRTSVVRMGGEFMLGLNREVREGANVEAGDAVDLQLELDTEPREVEVPPVLAAALAADPKLLGPRGTSSPTPTARSTRAGSSTPSCRRRASGGSRSSSSTSAAASAPVSGLAEQLANAFAALLELGLELFDLRAPARTSSSWRSRWPRRLARGSARAAARGPGRRACHSSRSAARASWASSSSRAPPGRGPAAP